MRYLLLSLLLITGSAQADLSASITAASEYQLTGVSQSAGEPVLQAGLHYQWENGVYVGTWAGSGIDFGCCDATIEVDYYVGYSRQTDVGWWWDISLNNYTYPGTYPGSTNLDYTETALQAGIGNWSARFGWSRNFLATDKHGFSTELKYTYPLGKRWSVVAHVGRTGGAALSRTTVGVSDFTDYAIGLVYQQAPFSAELHWVDTSLNIVNTANPDLLRSTGRWVFSITWAL